MKRKRETSFRNYIIPLHALSTDNAIKLLYEVKEGELEKRGVTLSWGP